MATSLPPHCLVSGLPRMEHCCIFEDNARSHAARTSIVSARQRAASKELRDECRWQSIPVHRCTVDTSKGTASKQATAMEKDRSDRRRQPVSSPAHYVATSSQPKHNPSVFPLVKPLRQLSLKDLQHEKTSPSIKSGRKKASPKPSNRRYRMAKQNSRKLIYSEDGAGTGVRSGPQKKKSICLKVSARDLKMILNTSSGNSASPVKIPVRQRSLKKMDY